MVDEKIVSGSDEMFEHYRFTADEKQNPLRIDKFLMNRIQNVSRNRIQQAAKNACILVNSVAVKNNYKVKPGDVISVVLPEPPRDTEIKPENISLDILYEDEHLLIVNKEAGMVVHPAYGNFSGTLVNALVYHFDNLPKRDETSRPGLVHRIDKDTSGLLVIAKTESALTHLAGQFFDHSIERRYIALVWGNPKSDQGTIDANLIRSPRDRRVMTTTEDREAGKNAITHYEVLERFGYTTLIACQLETGRTHQIRAHMKSVGHPIFSDETYGGRRLVSGPSFSKYRQFVQNGFKLLPRQALHAQSLGFVHPVSAEKMYFVSRLPDDMQAVIEKWRNYSRPFS